MGEQIIMRRITFLFAVLAISFSTSMLLGQSDLINEVRLALKSASFQDMATHFNDRVELTINGQAETYGRVQAEFVLKDFFEDYPPTDFNYVHQGASKDGKKFAIGNYLSEKGSFRVTLRIYKVEDVYKIISLRFDKE